MLDLMINKYKIFFIVFLLPGILFLPVGQGLQSQTASAEKWPETRDPRYTPPILPDGLTESGDSSELLLLLNGSDGVGLEAYLESRRKKQIEKKRNSNRYRERETQRLLERGQKRVLLERNLKEQFGVQNFPTGMGEYPYQETRARRFSIVFLLAFPVMAGFSYGLISGVKSLNGADPSFTNPENIATAILTLGGSLGIAWYDANRVERLQELNRLPEPLELRRGLIGEPPARPTQGNMVPRAGGQMNSAANHVFNAGPVLPFMIQFKFTL